MRRLALLPLLAFVFACGEVPSAVDEGSDDFAAPQFDHIGSHPTPCNEPATVGGGALGLSPGPTMPPGDVLGWDVGDGQCNGSFTVATPEEEFPGGTIELGLRAEQRRVGQVARVGLNDYEVQTGPDNTIPIAINRAWWNFHGSVAYQDDISTLDALTLEITTVVGPNLPSAASFDLLQLCPLIVFNVLVFNARNNAPNPTVQFSDFCQFSQNPEFGWFVPTFDGDANDTDDFNYDAPGAWIFNLTAVREDESAEVSICIHTPGVGCGELDDDDDDEDDDEDDD